MNLLLRTVLSGSLAIFSALAAAPTIASVENGFSFQPDLSPGVLATVFGNNLAGANLKVTINQIVCPVLYSSATQLNIQVPWQAAVGAGQIAVSNSGGKATAKLTIAKYSPALTIQDQAGNGIFYSGANLITANNPANGGDVLTTFGVGLGATNPAAATGVITPQPPPYYVTVVKPSLSVGTVHPAVIFSGLTPGSLAIDQLNFTLPAATPIGGQPVVMKIGNFQSNMVMIQIGCQDQTKKVKVTKGAVRHLSGSKYAQNVKIDNISGVALPAHGSLVVTGLTNTAQLTNAGGTPCPASDGSPHLSYTFTGSGSAQTVSLVLDFTDASTGAITYTARVLAP